MTPQSTIHSHLRQKTWSLRFIYHYFQRASHSFASAIFTPSITLRLLFFSRTNSRDDPFPIQTHSTSPTHCPMCDQLIARASYLRCHWDAFHSGNIPKCVQV